MGSYLKSLEQPKSSFNLEIQRAISETEPEEHLDDSVKDQNSYISTTEKTKLTPVSFGKYFFEFLRKTYGKDITTFFDLIENGTSALKYIVPRRYRKTRTTISFINHAIPFVVRGSDFVNRFQKYIYSLHRDTLSQSEKEVIAFLEFFKIMDQEVQFHNFSLQPIIINWLLNSPPTKKFKILNYYLRSGCDIEQTESDCEKDDYSKLIEIIFNDQRMIYEIFYDGGSNKSISRCTIVHLGNYDDLTVFRRAVLSEFIQSLDISKNILRVFNDDDEVSVEPINRGEPIQFKFHQVDIASYVTEIDRVLNAGGKRGYAFVGIQGTGKTQAIRKITNEFKKIPVLDLQASVFDYDEIIDDTFDLIEDLGKCILIIEDLDSMGMSEKDSRVGTFIKSLDRDLNMVVLVSINDTSRVHSTIIDRPERFDEVKEVKTPQSIEEVYDVMKFKFESHFKNGGIIKFPEMNLIDSNVIQDCINNRFTQASISSMMNKVFYILDCPVDAKSDNINKALLDAVNVLKESREAIDRCNFDNKNPNLKKYVD